MPSPHFYRSQEEIERDVYKLYAGNDAAPMEHSNILHTFRAYMAELHRIGCPWDDDRKCDFIFTIVGPLLKMHFTALWRTSPRQDYLTLEMIYIDYIASCIDNSIWVEMLNAPEEVLPANRTSPAVGEYASVGAFCPVSNGVNSGPRSGGSSA